MTCPHCAAAEANPRIGLYAKGCESCQARALAHSHDLWESSRAGKLTDRYLDVLVSIWGDRWRDGHAMVKEWHKKMNGAPDPETLTRAPAHLDRHV